MALFQHLQPSAQTELGAQHTSTQQLGSRRRPVERLLRHVYITDIHRQEGGSVASRRGNKIYLDLLLQVTWAGTTGPPGKQRQPPRRWLISGAGQWVSGPVAQLRDPQGQRATVYKLPPTASTGNIPGYIWEYIFSVKSKKDLKVHLNTKKIIIYNNSKSTHTGLAHILR